MNLSLVDFCLVELREAWGPCRSFSRVDFLSCFVFFFFASCVGIWRLDLQNFPCLIHGRV